MLKNIMGLKPILGDLLFKLKPFIPIFCRSSKKLMLFVSLTLICMVSNFKSPGRGLYQPRTPIPCIILQIGLNMNQHILFNF